MLGTALVLLLTMQSPVAAVGIIKHQLAMLTQLILGLDRFSLITSPIMIMA